MYPEPIQTENERLVEGLDRERRKSVCNKCKGKGYIITGDGIRSTESACFKCHGEGKVL